MLMRPVHPGVVLKDKLAEIWIAPTESARQIDMPPDRVLQIIPGNLSITGDSVLRFGHRFGTDPQFWLNLQSQHDLAVADREDGPAIRNLPTRTAL